MPSPLKIALVTDHFLPRIGGIELAVRDLALRLKEQGHEPHVITATRGDGTIGNIPVHRLSLPLLPGFKVIFNPLGLRKLKQLLQREAFDIVHAQLSVISPFAFGALLAAKESHIPATLTSHSLLEMSAHSFRILKNLLRYAPQGLICSAISRACSKGLSIAFPKATVVVLNNGIDTLPWRSIQKKPHAGIRVTSVMRMNRKKRPQDLVLAVAKLQESLPENFPLRVTLIGDGPYRSSVEKLIRKKGLQNTIQVTGRLSREEIQEYFSTTDIFALPSRKEAFGIAALEARCAGLPVLGMAYGGVEDVIQHGRQGLLAKNQKEFLEYLRQLTLDEGLREKFSQNAGQNLEAFDWSRIVLQQIAIYQKSISAHGSNTLDRKVG